MKKLLIFFAFIGMLATTALAQKNGEKASKWETIQIKTSAVCDMCIDTIEGALAYEKGVKTSKLDVKSKIVTVKYNPEKTNPEKIRKAITLAGYDADNLPADEKAYEKLDECCKKGAGCEVK